jgi:RNA polymerase sigma-70 factor (ECF subfamily)
METSFSVPFRPPVDVRDEPCWLAAARRGEPWALEQFYQAYQPRVYALCCRLLGRPEDAQDATQAAFVRAFLDLPRFRGESSVKTWLYRIAVNEALRMLRARRPTLELKEGSAEVGDGAPAVVERLAVRAAMARMKPESRAILTLRFGEGLSYQEIALVLGLTLPAVKMRLWRARQEFRRCYEE